MSLVWCRCTPLSGGLKGTNVNHALLKKIAKPASLSFIRHGHPAFTDEEFTLRKKAMAKWRRENWNWLTKELKVKIPTLDLGVITTKTEGLPEYSEEPEYPPVFDASPEGLKIFQRDQWILKLREYPTVEEKMYWMNERRYYGFKYFVMNPDHEPYGAMDFLKQVTRTRLEYGLPDYLGDERLENVVKQNLPRVKETLVDRLRIFKATQALEASVHSSEEKMKQNKEVIQVIVDALVQELGAISECAHLRSAAVDLTPRVEASWFCGGFYPHRLTRLSRGGLTDDEDKINAKVSYPFQILCDIAAQVRTEDPLPPVVEFSDPLVEHTEEKQVDWPFYPRTFQLPLQHRFGTSIPGYWPSDPNEFGQVAFAPRTFVDESSKYCFNGVYDAQEALDQRGMKTGFAWTFAQATYQGFEGYNDITYPLVSQVVITDGQNFGFYVYQLNTTKLHDEFATENPKSNLCWASDEMKLYEDVDAAGNLVGVNDTVVELLIKFMAHEPRKRAINMHPYLGVERFAQNLPEGDYKNYIADQFKFMMSNRPRYTQRPEIFAWEKIFKIDYNTRPRDGRKRWFELKENPNPSYEERLKRYVRKTKY